MINEEFIKKFESIETNFEFARAETLSPELQKKYGVDKGMVVIRKSFNPHPRITVFPIKDGDFVQTLTEMIIEKGHKESLQNPFV
ncbi:MAG: hypothetical protein COY38_01050 [Candidatus Aenigmarchaeota archaeon CG_4_10_14_0_8_um_filter_37_24]|nr:hypothetical protein [Candidatus Aenigmarchaeota archaeon]OIN87997.1 MAG: hypothetical protein AUJ50_01915 [Candidatus Aenigmarchaeota archaeon CG1_02_38_14]PIW41449.1 MAG: hypothetical protein COW21_01810 [Candidatus Aenigmarchaeota archaeon CG15_BIG_FIL_POST_REV_8_21_14_020_37_27]PIX50767.1 MAG: hypothetical protein COZ52_02315 [Candidatus Aenigmarchaeota archaeon CG_4_8_14_3_um_filter_37_24]PIZ36050.1 MAG: hypothetical protein COY38_01050 [Candidatus Aenigmarchaeota archaeon CG_4_10_14_0_